MPAVRLTQVFLAATVAVVPVLAACSRRSEPSSSAPSAETHVFPQPPSEPPPTTGSSLAWDVPARWQRQAPSSSFRVAEYLVPRSPGDSADGECSVTTFGPNQGGDIDQNIARWSGQFEGAEPTRTTRPVHGMLATKVELHGVYHGMRSPQGDPGLSDWKMIGAIVNAPSGLWFFKLTGPAATITAAASEFDAMIDSCQMASRKQ